MSFDFSNIFCKIHYDEDNRSTGIDHNCVMCYFTSIYLTCFIFGSEKTKCIMHRNH